MKVGSLVSSQIYKVNQMSGVEKRTVTKDEDGMRLDRWFKSHFPTLSFGEMNKIIRKGEVRVDGKRAKTNDRIEQGQEIRVPPLKSTSADDKPKPVFVLSKQDLQDVRNMIVYEDEALLVFNKPTGLAAQGGTKSNHKNLDDLANAYLRQTSKNNNDDDQARLVHRLDKDTSGIQVLAKTRKAAQHLSRQFQQKKAQKTYLALTRGVPEQDEGEIALPLLRRKDKTVVDFDEGKKAFTDIEVVDKAGRKLALVKAMPKTGRNHQIRVHLAYIGTPILGDDRYNDNYINDEEEFFQNNKMRLFLHAYSIEIEHPTMGKKVEFEAPLDQDFKDLMKKLGFSLAKF